MRDLRHLILHFKNYGRRHQALYLLASIFLFWAVFDGITTYITPLVLTEKGLSKTAMGLIYSSSSVFGAILDFFMCKLFKNASWRRSFLAMFLFSGLYLLALASAKTVWFYLVAMLLWGIYYDLKSFGSFDFVARFTRLSEHSSSFGVLSVFQASGYLLAPLLAGALITKTVGMAPFVAAGIFLAVAFLLLISLITREKSYQQEPLQNQYRYRGIFHEIKLWRRLDKVLLPVLILIGTLNIVDSFFWTVGPLLAESFDNFHQFAGLFMVAYELPTLLIGWFVGSVTRRWGKKKISFIALLAGSLVLMPLGYLRSPIIMILVVFISSLLMSFSWPALKAAFADYIAETGKYEKEIEGLEDLYTNLGYVIGPVLAGFLADQLGNAQAFSVLGGLGVVIAVYLMKITPKHINVMKSL